MLWEQWMAFITASVVLFLLPGPDMLLVAGWSAAKGFKAGIQASMGTVSGILVHTLATSMGLAALLAASATAFLLVKYAGAVYLVYLGVMTLRHRENRAEGTSVDRKAGNPFVQALLTNVLNPKVILFFLAFLPQFIEPSGNTTNQLLMLGSAFALIATIGYLVLVFIACRAGEKIGSNAKVKAFIRWLGGLVLIGFGLRLAMVSRG